MANRHGGSISRIYRSLKDSEISKAIEDEGKWGNKKSLVYDGQQRLQTLYSCLKYTFNNRVLTFDLLWEKNIGDDDNLTSGFTFHERSNVLPWNEIRLNELFGKNIDQEIKVRKEIFKKALDNSVSLTDESQEVIEKNLSQLWKVFVTTDKKSISYFSIPSNSDIEVNEIFQRLNSSGVPLSQADLLLSRIKEKSPDFEEKLINASAEIKGKSGFEIDQYLIIQLLFLIVKGEVRLEAVRVNKNELNAFVSAWDHLARPLQDFFIEFLGEQFKINHEAIIPSKRALFPLIIYFFNIYKHEYTFKKDVHEKSAILTKLMQFFIKSQINNWDLQRYIDKFTRVINEPFENHEIAAKQKEPESFNKRMEIVDFPLEKIEAYINEGKERDANMTEERFINKRLFALKILCFDKSYNFSPSKSRFSPEIDHIFPRKLKAQSENFASEVDILWNLQPVRGEINGYKSNYHPKDFFNDKLYNSSGDLISGGKYFGEYDFVPDKESLEWDNPLTFIENRRSKMLQRLKSRYDLSIVEKANTADKI